MVSHFAFPVSVKALSLFVEFNTIHFKSYSNYAQAANQQESPPAWTQEAYQPQCNKHSICCPILGSTYLGQGAPTLGYPPPDLAGGGTYCGRYLPWPGGTYLGWGVPTLAGGYLPWGTPILTCPGGYLPWGSPIWTWPGYPHPVWTDWKHYLPPILQMRLVIKTPSTVPMCMYLWECSMFGISLDFGTLDNHNSCLHVQNFIITKTQESEEPDSFPLFLERGTFEKVITSNYRQIWLPVSQWPFFVPGIFEVSMKK